MRAYHDQALLDEFQRRGIDVSAVYDGKAITFARPVRYDLPDNKFLCLFRNYSYFCTLKSKRFEIMTALQLNAELFRELSIIAEDENLMKKAVKYLKKLSAKKQAMDETEYIMSSPEMVRILRQGEEDIKNGNFRIVKLDDIWK